MAKITNVTYGNEPAAVVADTWFEFRVTFAEAINVSTFQKTAFAEGIEVYSITGVTGHLTTRFDVVAKFIGDSDKKKISLNLQGIEDDATDTAADDTDIESATEITVLLRPTFSVQAFDPTNFPIDFFNNPLSDNLRFSVQTQPSGIGGGVTLSIGTHDRELGVPSIAQSVVDSGKLVSDAFVDKPFQIRATNDAGNLDIDVILRVLSSLPTSNIS